MTVTHDLGAWVTREPVAQPADHVRPVLLSRSLGQAGKRPDRPAGALSTCGSAEEEVAIRMRSRFLLLAVVTLALVALMGGVAYADTMAVHRPEIAMTATGRPRALRTRRSTSGLRAQWTKSTACRSATGTARIGQYDLGSSGCHWRWIVPVRTSDSSIYPDTSTTAGSRSRDPAGSVNFTPAQLHEHPSSRLMAGRASAMRRVQQLATRLRHAMRATRVLSITGPTVWPATPHVGVPTDTVMTRPRRTREHPSGARPHRSYDH